MSELSLEKMKIDERLKTVEKSLTSLDGTIQEIQAVLFGERGEKGVVGKLKDLIEVANKIETTIGWIAKLIFGALILAALPSVATFINMITHAK